MLTQLRADNSAQRRSEENANNPADGLPGCCDVQRYRILKRQQRAALIVMHIEHEFVFVV